MPYQRPQVSERRLSDLIGLVQDGHHSPTDLAGLLKISVPTVSRAIRNLRDRGHPIEATLDEGA